MYFRLRCCPSFAICNRYFTINVGSLEPQEHSNVEPRCAASIHHFRCNTVGKDASDPSSLALIILLDELLSRQSTLATSFGRTTTITIDTTWIVRYDHGYLIQIPIYWNPFWILSRDPIEKNIYWKKAPKWLFFSNETLNRWRMCKESLFILYRFPFYSIFLHTYVFVYLFIKSFVIFYVMHALSPFWILQNLCFSFSLRILTMRNPKSFRIWPILKSNVGRMWDDSGTTQSAIPIDLMKKLLTHLGLLLVLMMI